MSRELLQPTGHPKIGRPGTMGHVLYREFRESVTEDQQEKCRVASTRLKNAVQSLPDNGVEDAALLNATGTAGIQQYLRVNRLIPEGVGVADVRVELNPRVYESGLGNNVRAEGPTVEFNLVFPELEAVALSERPVEEPVVEVSFLTDRPILSRDKDGNIHTDPDRSRISIVCTKASFKWWIWEHPNDDLKRKAAERMNGIIEEFADVGKTDVLVNLVDQVTRQISIGNAEKGRKPWRNPANNVLLSRFPTGL
jgi:hypothetical protein